ncbi:glutathione S-transferase family protein [Ideonella sp.]|uniref:glutathione S-transferase family protein n=1 Tax=Ideonella sp. TaxID=1929293 RepID=UPI0039C858C9
MPTIANEGASPVALQLYYHPFSSYSQKALVALYENAIPFEPQSLDGPDSPASRRLAELWPMKRFPVLVDGERTILEASCIVEYLALHRPGPVRLIPEDPDEALEARMLDRFFDNYISTPQQKIVFNALRPAAARDAYGEQEARDMLDTAYAWLNERMAGREWAVGDRFSLADCGAAPFLFYADWTHAIGDAYPHVKAYRRRLLARPSFARAVDEARPYRPYFPLGAPDRD